MHTVYFCRLVEEVFEGGLNLGDHLSGGHGTTAPHEGETVTLTSQGARGVGSSDRRPVTPEKFTARQRKNICIEFMKNHEGETVTLAS